MTLTVVIACALTGFYFLLRRPGGLPAHPFLNYLMGLFCLWSSLTIVSDPHPSPVVSVIGLVLISGAGLFMAADLFYRIYVWKADHPFFSKRRLNQVPDFALEICKALGNLAESHIGALVVIKREDILSDYTSDGIPFDADVKADVLVSIFSPKSPIHDGAVVIHHNRVRAVKVILPVSTDNQIPVGVGTRHRSAISITEKTDAIALVVSEERGEVSFVFEGEMQRVPSQAALLRLIQRALKKKPRHREMALAE